MSLISVDPLWREPYLVKFDRDGSVEDSSFQGGVSGVWYCCSGKCHRLPSDPLTLSRHEQRDMPEYSDLLLFKQGGKDKSLFSFLRWCYVVWRVF